jgi:hypothetical protein
VCINDQGLVIIGERGSDGDRSRRHGGEAAG